MGTGRKRGPGKCVSVIGWVRQGQDLFLYDLYTRGRGEGKESRAKSVFFLPVREKESGQSTYSVVDIHLFNSEICFKYDNFKVINLLPWGLWLMISSIRNLRLVFGIRNMQCISAFSFCPAASLYP